MDPRALDTSRQTSACSVQKSLRASRELPDTIADRSIQIRLKRKGPGEKVDRFRTKLVLGDANRLRVRLMAWIQEHLESL